MDEKLESKIRIELGDSPQQTVRWFEAVEGIMREIRVLFDIVTEERKKLGFHIIDAKCKHMVYWNDPKTDIAHYLSEVEFTDSSNRYNGYKLDWYLGKEENIRFYTIDEVINTNNYKPVIMKHPYKFYPSGMFVTVPTKRGFLFMDKIFVPYQRNTCFITSSANNILQFPTSYACGLRVVSHDDVDKFITLNENESWFHIEPCGYQNNSFKIILKGDVKIFLE